MGSVEAIWLAGDGTVERGGGELVAKWQADPDSRIWLDLYGLPEQHEEPFFQAFGLHALAIRDARRTNHPPKIELFEDHLFILLSELTVHGSELEFSIEQLALFTGPRFLLTRHNGLSKCVDQWRKAADVAAVLKGGGIRLALEMAITSARRQIELLFEFEPRLSELEDEIQDRPDDTVMTELIQYRTRLRKLRRLFSYEARVFESLRLVKVDFFNAASYEHRHLVLDVYEKYEQLLSLSTLYYELAGDLVDGYISLTNHALNSTMRVLTAITAIFVPLGFVAGLYGMNFEYMPELSWRWGYFTVLGGMALVIIILVSVFRKNRWL